MRPSCKLCGLLLAGFLLGEIQLRAQTVDQQAVIGMLRSASDAVRRGDTATAESTFKRVTEIAPGLSDGYFGLGMVQLRENRPDDASRALARAVEVNPLLYGAHLYLGIAQYQMGQANAAIESFKAETLLRPGQSEAYSWLGIAELNQNHPELAIGPLDTAKALDPKDPQILYYCGRAHLLEAEADYRKLAELNPNSALVHRGLAESFDAGGQPEKSIAEYEAAIKQEPNNPDLYEALGEANLKMSRRPAAQQAYEHALALNAHSAIALYNLGRIDVESGKPEDGVALLRKAEAVHASPAPTDFYLGLGLAETGKNAEAATWLERSLSSQPSAFMAQSAYYQLARVYKRLNRNEDAQKALVTLSRLKAEAAKTTAEKGDQVHEVTPFGEPPGPKM